MVTITRKSTAPAPTAAGGVAGIPAQRSGSAGAGPGQAAGPSRNLLVVLTGVVVIAVAAISSMLLSGGGDDGALTTVTTPTARASRSATPSPSASGTAGGAAGTAAATGRNPFGGLAVTGGTGTAAATATATATATGAPQSTPTTAPPATASGPAATVTTTVVGTSTRTATTTVTAASLYLGLYGWSSDDKPLFRVNEVAVNPSAGATFAPDLVYVSKYVSSSLTCANITYKKVAMSVCAGEVLHLA